MPIVIESIKTNRTSKNTIEVIFRADGSLRETFTYKITSDYINDLLPIGPETGILACIPRAMKLNQDIISDIPIDPVFLSHMEHYQNRMRAQPAQDTPPGWQGYHRSLLAWKNSINKIRVLGSETLHMGASDKKRMGVFFSGGTDSIYTIMGVHEIDDAIVIKNMNYPNIDNVLKAIKSLRPEMRVHIVEVPDFICNQKDTTLWLRFNHGPFIFSVAHLFSNYLTGIVLSGTDRGPGFEIGSGYDVDYLMSSSKIRLFSYGNKSRFHKIKFFGEHQRSQEIFNNLQTCSDHSQRADKLNCSNCWKCLFTMLEIEALGLETRATSFDFNGFHERVKQNMFDLPFSDDYAFLGDLKLIIAEYEKHGDTEMAEKCKEYLNSNAIPGYFMGY